MTGYGNGEASSGGIKVMVELSSVNHKQFDVRLDLPGRLMFAESRIRKQIHERIARGFVNCRIKFDMSSSFRERGVIVDEALAEAYVVRLRKAAKRLGLKEDLSVSVVLTLPGVVRARDPEDRSDTLMPLVTKGLKYALVALIAMRVSEGKALCNDIRARTKELQGIMDRLSEQAPKVSERYRRTLKERVRASGVELDLDDPRFLREVALFADRSDISEEIIRLRSHLKQTLKTFTSTTPVGRRLDFLLQEMFREITTIGSKANDETIVNEVIRFKAELERVREQVQNIE